MRDQIARNRVTMLETQVQMLSNRCDIATRALLELREAYDELFDFIAEELGVEAVECGGVYTGLGLPKSPRRLKRISRTTVVRRQKPPPQG